MKCKLLVIAFCLLFTQSVFSAHVFVRNNIKFSKIIFFGDSLSDNGNFYRDVLYYMPKNPPYYNGRFSNGQVWSEYVDEYFLERDKVESSNYAVGGQTAYFHNPFDGYLPYSLAMSRENYILHTLFADRSSTLFIIWIGANDYLPGISDVETLTTDVTDAIKSTIEDLIYHGGENFLLLNLPDLSSTPYGQASGYADKLKAATIVHNIKLNEVVASLRESYKNIHINLYDINRFFDSAIQHSVEYNKKYNTHITNVTGSCWMGGYTFASIKVTEEFIAKKIREHTRYQTMAGAQLLNIHTENIAHFIATSPALLEAFMVSNHDETGVTACENPADYLFWDTVHPSSIPHKIIGQELISFIDANYNSIKS